jgi:hypothetical protein
MNMPMNGWPQGFPQQGQAPQYQNGIPVQAGGQATVPVNQGYAGNPATISVPIPVPYVPHFVSQQQPPPNENHQPQTQQRPSPPQFDAEAYRQAAMTAQQRAEAAERAAAAERARVQGVEQQLQHVSLQLQRQEEMIRQSQEQAYEAQLGEYRMRVIQSYKGQLISEMVGGRTPQEVDQSAAAAHQKWNQLRQEFSSQGRPPIPNQPPPPPVQQPQNQGGWVQGPNGQWFQSQQGLPPAMPVPPNPAYAGFPTPTNPMAPQSMDPSTGYDVSALTSEEAVRSGAFGQYRQQLHQMAGARQQGGFPSGSVPRGVGRAPNGQFTSLNPGGVVQPQGYPTGPAVNPGMANGLPPMPQRPIQGQVPQGYNGFMPPGSVDPGVQAAQEAISRVNNGQVGPGVANYLGAHGTSPMSQAQLTQQYAQNNMMGSVDPMSAYGQRFQPTPPIQQQG